MEPRLSGKVAIVTGSGRGIGQAVALRLAHEGADVVVADISVETAEQTSRQIRALGRKVLAQPTDVARLADIQLMVDRAVAEFGRIDILVNAAGIIQTKVFLEMTEDDWDRIVDTNLKGTVFCIQAVSRQMIRQIPKSACGGKAGGQAASTGSPQAGKSHGKIVNFSSISGRRGRSLQLAYAASKAGIISATQSAALALSPYNINVNAVCPGVIDTPMWEQIDRERGKIAGVQPGESMKTFVEMVPLRRPGSSQDVAGAVAFLCSSDADYITGQALNVDGGFEMD
jgi:NAD(P)-dependent dehydrogenase (short-subunit alcohol dehydrogenase family)